MAKKEKDFLELIKDSMTKLVNIFPNDIYVVHNRYVIAGDKTEDNTIGYFFCIFEPHIMEAWKKKFPDNPIIYIESLRESKTSGEYRLVENGESIKKIEDKIECLINQFKKPNTWATFDFSDGEKTKIFTNNESFILFENDSNKYSIIISKTIFPLITAKTINDVAYACADYEIDDSLHQLLVQYNHEYFQLNMKYIFMQM